jgi:hypothetical protein
VLIDLAVSEQIWLQASGSVRDELGEAGSVSYALLEARSIDDLDGGSFGWR